MIQLFVTVLFTLTHLVNCQFIDIRCPRGWTEERNQCYKFTRTPTKNREDAFRKCREYGAELLSVTNEEKHQFIIDWLRSNDPQHKQWYTSASFKNGQWYWDGDGSQFINIEGLWHIDLDNDNLGGDAVYTFLKKTGRWGLKRIDGYEKLGYICEISKNKLKNNRLLVEERAPDFGIEVTDEKFIPRAPKFTVEPVDAIFDTSSRNQIQDVQLRCVADAYPFPVYKWFKEGFKNNEVVSIIIEPLKDSRLTQTDGILNIHEPHQNDLGNYHCLAQNEFGIAISKSVQLSFGYIAEFSKARSSESGQAYWGKALFCDPPNHYPAIQYNWARQEFPHFVQEDKRLFVSMDGNLYFTALEKSDEATYSCNVQSVISSTGRTGPFFTLTVESGSSSQVLQFPNNFPKAFPEVPLAGQDVRLECVAFGFPVPSYSWAREGVNRELPPKAVLQNRNRVLLLPKISIEDIGDYICTASNSKTSIQNTVSLDIRANPVFTIPLEDQFLDADSKLSWFCEAFGIPEVKYKWLKNGREIKINILPEEDRARYKIEDNILTIEYLDARRDQGVYQCKAYNSLAASYSSAWLKILSFKPSFRKYPLPQEMYAVIGGNITIPCQPEGAPKPTFTWRRNGVVVGNGGNTRIHSNGHLTISPVRREDEGTYSCRARNTLGEDRSSGILIVLDQPRMRVSPQDDVMPQVNDSIQLPCQAGYVDSDLELSYVWLKNDVPIDFDTDLFIELGDYAGDLRIRRVQLHHSGIYTCVIKTPLMTISKSTRIQVRGPPGPPGGLTASTPTSNSTELRWTNGTFNGAPITAFTIEGETDHLDGWVVLAENVTNVRGSFRGLNVYKVDGLLSPFSLYRFRIRAINEFGIGPPSFPSPQYKTLGDKPSVYPKDVSGGGGNIGDLTMRWSMLEPQDWNAMEIWYIIYWKEYASKEEFIKKDLRHLGNIEMYVETVGSDNFYRQYLFKIQAVNEYGSGPISPEVMIWSAENLPDVAPDRVTLSAFNSTAMNVSWTAVDQSRDSIRGTLVGHRIKYWDGNDLNIVKYAERAETLLVRGTQSWGIVVGLQPDSWYTMTVSVYNNAGSGAMSAPSAYRTFKKAPVNPPTSIQIKALTKTSILIKWRYVTPSIEEEPIIGYKVRYWEKGQELENAIDVIVYRGQKRLEAQVTGLVPGKIYSLRVLAFSQGGDGKMSSPAVEFRMGSRSAQASRSFSPSIHKRRLTTVIACSIVAITFLFIAV